MDKDLVTIVFGDSIVYGIGDYEYGGWVNRLKIKLANLNNHNYVVNLGIPGEGTKNILNRFETELKNRFNNEDKFKLIFSIGIKDSLLLNNDSNYLNIFKENIENIINISTKYTNDICFVGLLIPDFEIRKEYNLDNVLKIDKVIEECSINHNLKYINIKDIILKYDLCDGLHPNNIGHKKISDEILKIYE